MAVNKIVGKLSNPNEQEARDEIHYEWTAKYIDNTELKQYDDEKGLAHHFGHIDQDLVYEFVLVPKNEALKTISVNLLSGLFYLGGRPINEVVIDNETHLPLGLFLENKKVVSPWGNKAKLIFARKIRRDFHMGSGTMGVSMNYLLGWEAKVDGKPEKHTVVFDEAGRIALPPTPEQEGFEAL